MMTERERHGYEPRTCSWCGQFNGEHTAACFDRQRSLIGAYSGRMRPPWWYGLFGNLTWVAVGYALAHLI
jgi:hypothetical protein